MDFYYMDCSAPCRSVMLTAKALGLDLNKKCVDLFKGEHMTPEFLSLNPQHTIPTLVDGDLELWESRAICTYLVSKYGKDDSLYPSKPEIRVLVDKLLYFDMGTLFKRFVDYVMPVLFHNQKPDETKLDVISEALGWLNGFLEGHEFAVGDHVTVADFCLVSTVSTFQEGGICLAKFPNVVAWLKRCKSQMKGYESENEAGAKKFGEMFKSKVNA